MGKEADKHKITFKQSENGANVRVKTDSMLAVVIGSDSFFVTRKCRVERNMGATVIAKSELIQFVAKIGDLTFGRHYKIASEVTKTYQVQIREASQWESFPVVKQAFKKVALK